MLRPIGFMRKAAAASGGSARSSDTAAVYWYAPDSVVESGGVISAWDDKTTNSYNLGQIGAEPLPSYNAGGYVEFSSGDIIGDADFTHANSLMAELDGGGSIALFIVGEVDSSGQAGSSTVAYYLWQEAASSGNQRMLARIDINTFVSPRTGAFAVANRRFADAFSFATTASSTQADIPALMELVVTQLSADLDINNGAFTATATPATADFADSGTGLFIGASYDGSSVGDGFVGKIYEVFATTDASSTNVDAIRTELMTEYGL